MSGTDHSIYSVRSFKRINNSDTAAPLWGCSAQELLTPTLLKKQKSAKQENKAAKKKKERKKRKQQLARISSLEALKLIFHLLPPPC